MTQSVRVGFTMLGGSGWLGGSSYLRNLLLALGAQRDLAIEPVLFTAHDNDAGVADIPSIELVRSSIMYAPRALRVACKGISLVAGHDLLKEQELRKHRIDVLSHSGHLGHRALLPTIGWLADLQSIHFPDLEIGKDRSRRDHTHREYCKYCTKIIVASECGRRDLRLFSPQTMDKAEVLRFVSQPISREHATPLPELRRKFNIDKSYFLLPNQFWAHKNHRTVISALRLLKKRSHDVLVLATGNTKDTRNPGYFESVMKHARDCNVLDCFRVLGVIPSRDLAGLFYEAIAVLNPSLFEGWSTSVEESKSIGKSIILSDIPVHREQRPDRGIYFPPLEPESLANAMQQAWDEFDPNYDRLSQERALTSFPARQRQFALRYQGIVISAISDSH